MATKLGTLSHAKGFVVNKLYEQRRFGGSHVPVAFLSQGYPPKWRRLARDAIEDLKKEGTIRVEVKRTGRGSGLHATLAKNALSKAMGSHECLPGESGSSEAWSRFQDPTFWIIPPHPTCHLPLRYMVMVPWFGSCT